MRYFIVMALLCSCAEGGPPDNGIDGTDEVLDLPLGSFCLGDDVASRVCLPPDTVSVTVSSSGGATHVRHRPAAPSGVAPAPRPSSPHQRRVLLAQPHAWSPRPRP